MLGWSYSIKINDCFFLVLNKSTEIIKAATLKVLIEWFVESSILLIKQNKKWIIWRRQQIKRSWLAITRYVPENQKGMWARRQDRSWFIECSVLVTLCLAVCCYPCDYFTCRWIELWEGMCKSQLCVEVSSTAVWHHKVEICQPLLLLPRGSLLVVGLTSPQSHLPCVLLWFDCYGLCYCFCLLSFVPPCSYLK